MHTEGKKGNLLAVFCGTCISLLFIKTFTQSMRTDGCWRLLWMPIATMNFQLVRRCPAWPWSKLVTTWQLQCSHLLEPCGASHCSQHRDHLANMAWLQLGSISPGLATVHVHMLSSLVSPRLPSPSTLPSLFFTTFQVASASPSNLSSCPWESPPWQRPIPFYAPLAPSTSSS